MEEIYHMLTAGDWERAKNGPEYRDASFETEGFLHCTSGERNLVDVANRYYRNRPGEWLVLVLDPARIRAEVRWEVQPDGMAYPHVYGPLNLDAVVEVCRFERDGAAFRAFRDAPYS